MKPLSILNYYKNNKKRFLSIFLSITLSVFIIYTIQMVILSSFKIADSISIEPKMHYSTVAPKGEVLNRRIISSLSTLYGVDRIIPCVFDYTTFRAGIGSNYSTAILSLGNEDITFIMEKLNLSLIQGKLPTNNEIILHKRVAKNKNLKVGDYIGRMISKEESLPGSYKVVGIIDGKSIVSFAPIDYYISRYNLPYPYIYGGLILPKEGRLEEMNTSLAGIGPSDFQITRLTDDVKWLKDSTIKINILLTLVSILIILIVSSCIGFLCYIYFLQRRSEFGLLWAIGYSRQQVINRAFAEVNSVNIAGFLCGLLLSFLVGILLNMFYFDPIGDPLQIINFEYMLGAACSPVFVTLSSLIPVWRMLKRMDPISIIEGVV